MAWTKIEQSLPTHRKTKQLARELQLDPHEHIPRIVGHLTMLWLWCLDNARDGNLSAIDPRDIADATGWNGDSQTFVRALTAAGFVDNDRRLHAWDEYSGVFLEKSEQRKAANRERQRRCRERRIMGSSGADASSQAQTVPNAPEPTAVTGDIYTHTPAQPSRVTSHIDSDYPVL
jgi:hypothetical protein